MPPKKRRDKTSWMHPLMQKMQGNRSQLLPQRSEYSKRYSIKPQKSKSKSNTIALILRIALRSSEKKVNPLRSWTHLRTTQPPFLLSIKNQMNLTRKNAAVTRRHPLLIKIEMESVPSAILSWWIIWKYCNYSLEKCYKSWKYILNEHK